MDKLKNVTKGGWHPSGDKAIHRDTWKSDLKGMTTNRNKDPYEAQRNHQSAPLTSLKDPDSFGPPPKHTGWYGNNGMPTSPAAPSASTGGLGSAIRTPARIPTREQREQEAAQQEEKPKPSGPYRADTTGLSTANLPKPPVRRADGTSPAPPPRSAASPHVPARQAQSQPAQAAPPPMLPPRQNEHPDEYTPPPPPTYQEATVQPAVQPRPAPQNPATINGVAANRLAQAGVNVPGFGIGGNSSSTQATPPQSPSTQGHPSQLSELQQRFSRMGTGSSSTQRTSPPPTPPSANMAAAATQKKPPPPPPPKKAALGGSSTGAVADAGAPPPLPLSSKPRPS